MAKYHAVIVLECDGALILTNIFLNACIHNSGTALFYGTGHLAIDKVFFFNVQL